MVTLHETESDENLKRESDELEEEVHRLRALVCELLCVNQQLRFQIAQNTTMTRKADDAD